MSQWTHVAGIIRLDSMGFAMVRLSDEVKLKQLNEAIKNALGNTYSYEDNPEAFGKCSVPTGSEGSLQYKVSRNTDENEHALSWGFVSIWGDLRDFGAEDVQGVVDWFQQSLDRLIKPDGFGDPAEMTDREKADYMLSAFMIRDAVLSVSVEFIEGRTILLWDEEEKKVYSYPRPITGTTT